ncbi:helix-turn-helix transcriptional regulator [Sinorhizobium sp. BG8]|uniref:transcriptional regulator VisN n=1 Tax=Sinorhizobium sp. BG8 TaxID=2613773 RepID=UPI00193E9301|nr:helix-turn-helix transcriptional regulator [Sinorhizobium sp. BG8]QRM54216.1 helix-turn-helix transcriptional regulator [Sinorhizobium sp. BG8]
MDTIRADVAAWESVGFPAASDERKSARELLVQQLGRYANSMALSSGLRALTDYVSASHFLLLRQDTASDSSLDLVVASDWPFDLVKNLVGSIGGSQARTSELDKCLAVLQPSFVHMPETIAIPAGISREYCIVTFNVGRTRMSLLLLFGEHFILSQSKLRDIGLLAGYFASLSCRAAERQDRELELTEREIECLFWIAEGKTSDEIAVILGISRNTINNYITSVMRKTATRTRSEAIAWAVRNNLV